MKPYRILAAAFLLIIAGELVAIHRTPTYDLELMEAQARYVSALRTNNALRSQLLQEVTR